MALSNGSKASDTIQGGSSEAKGSGAENNAVKLVVDGYWGRKTILRLQKIFGTPADGIVSNQHQRYKSQTPGLDSGWE